MGRKINLFAAAAFSAAIVLAVFSIALFLMPHEPKMPEKNCGDCHVKANPEKGDAALLPEPRNHPEFEFLNKKTTSFLAARDHDVPPADHNGPKLAPTSNEPNVVMMDELVDKYGPVSFSHKAHADMAQMSGSCWSCHHNSPADKPHPECKACHKVNPDPKNPSLLRLKAAYHRQCIDCHKKWSGGNNCDVCHEKVVKGKVIAPPRISWKPLVQPSRLVYKTTRAGTVVTFFHDNHTKLFNIPCEDCHKKATCADCHDRNKKTRTVPEKGHKTCSGCHDTVARRECSRCHRHAPMDAYTHNDTGFPLSPYHTKLKCSACHHEHRPVQKLDTDCRSCHKGYDFKGFSHASTGFDIRKYHSGVACAKCHPANKPMRPASSNCTACHGAKIIGFNHASSGFPLSAFHAKLDCARCHPASRPMSTASPRCEGCHPGMRFKNFDHAQTGFPLSARHAKLDCTACHKGGKFTSMKKDCKSCHPGLKFDGFDHSSTGFPLKKFHASQPCGSCHGESFAVSSPSPECNSCHKDGFKNFDHAAATGLALDDMHGSLDCSSCHAKGYNKPDCSDCHGTDKSYPKDKPGT